MERDLFDAVQQKLTDQWTARTSVRNAGDHLLTGLLFDDAGPPHGTDACDQGRPSVIAIMCRLPCLHGEAKTAKVGSVTRVPATDIEDVVVNALNEYFRTQRGNAGFGHNRSQRNRRVDRPHLTFIRTGSRFD